MFINTAFKGNFQPISTRAVKDVILTHSHLIGVFCEGVDTLLAWDIPNLNIGIHKIFVLCDY